MMAVGDSKSWRVPHRTAQLSCGQYREDYGQQVMTGDRDGGCRMVDQLSGKRVERCSEFKQK